MDLTGAQTPGGIFVYRNALSKNRSASPRTESTTPCPPSLRRSQTVGERIQTVASDLIRFSFRAASQGASEHKTFQELVVEAAERQRVRNYARKPRCGWFRVLKAIVGRLARVGPDLRAGRSNEEGRYLFSAGSSEICPYRGLRIPWVTNRADLFQVPCTSHRAAGLCER